MAVPPREEWESLPRTRAEAEQLLAQARSVLDEADALRKASDDRYRRGAEIAAEAMAGDPTLSFREVGRLIARSHAWVLRVVHGSRFGRRRNALRHRTPPWSTDADRAAVLAVYRECPPDHHIDHVVPLKHPLVAGLHVPQNLRYLPGPENVARGNRMDVTPDQAVEYIARGMAVWTAHTDQRPHQYMVPDWDRVAYANPASSLDIPPQPKPGRAVAIRPASEVAIPSVA